MIFYCKNCDFDFEIQNPLKKEYTDPVFVPCAKYVGNYIECGLNAKSHMDLVYYRFIPKAPFNEYHVVTG